MLPSGLDQGKLVAIDLFRHIKALLSWFFGDPCIVQEKPNNPQQNQTKTHRKAAQL